MSERRSDSSLSGNISPARLGPVELPDTRDEEHRGCLLIARPGAYISIVLAVLVAAGAYSLRTFGIISCPASGYGSDRYLGYCGATGFGDYDYGAFWFGLEPKAIDAATNAQVLFLGNSRMQFGLSTAATANWFGSLPVLYYLLGFSHNGNYTFEGPLLHRLRPKAKAYVINIDLFFEQSETPPARAVMRDGSAKSRYEQKRGWQRIHKPLCQSLPALCGHNVAFFRSIGTGAWVVTGGRFTSKPVSYSQSIDRKVLEAYAASGSDFLSHLPVSRECAILTMVPTVDTPIGTAKAIADAVGLRLVAPELPGLNTFDESHLDRESAQRWSEAFIEAAGPQILKCVDAQTGRLAEARAPDVGSDGGPNAR